MRLIGTGAPECLAHAPHHVDCTRHQPIVHWVSGTPEGTSKMDVSDTAEVGTSLAPFHDVCYTAVTLCRGGAMASIWKGSLAFGPVSTPVEPKTALRADRISFRFLHAEDLSPLRHEDHPHEEEGEEGRAPRARGRARGRACRRADDRPHVAPARKPRRGCEEARRAARRAEARCGRGAQAHPRPAAEDSIGRREGRDA